MDAQILENVKSRLETARVQLLIGWTRGVMFNELGEVCALGALTYGRGEPLAFTTYDEILHGRADDLVVTGATGFLVRNLPSATGREDVVDFNNSQKTVGPVIDLFDRAIADVKQQIADLP